MREQTLFDFPEVKIEKKIRLIELFGGIGSQAMALRDIGADSEHYRLVEFDKYAVKSYNAIHGTNFETSDVRNIHAIDLGIERRNEFTYLLTYSFPCTDLSVAGKMQGMSKKGWLEGKSTRSGLLWEVERILTECGDNLPDILLMENVPQVHQDKNIDDFNSWTEFLRKKGYSNFIADMNATDYGVAQNRERCFMVSVLSDSFIEFEFPEPIELEKVIDDYLETDVDDKFFITSEKADKLIESLVAREILPAIEQRAESGKSCQCAVDLSIREPKKLSRANCIKARYDAGISNLQSDGTGIVSLIGGEQKHQSVKLDGVCTCLCSSMGTGGGYVPLLVWEK